MLATAGAAPVVTAGWAVEFKWDGVRAIVAGTPDGVTLTSRNGNDVTAGYPELVRAGSVGGWAAGRSVVLDGELVALDGAGRPDFGLLQHRMHLRHPAPEVVERVPVALYVFDLLEIDGESLLREPYDVRRGRLDELGLGEVPGVQVPPSVPDVPAVQLLEVARAHGLEGIVAKRRASRYEPGRRSSAWVKTALLSAQEVLVAGWTAGEGRRAGGVGALLLAAHDGAGRLRFLGHVGTGFTDAVLRDLHARLAPLHRDTSPFDADEVPREYARPAHWVDPVLVGEVEYRTLTHDHRLRHAVWRGLRPDRDPDEIVLLPRVPRA
ncbi:DNA ligase [Pseudonocardia petroleophila]|uniref:DNA ligase (ATP) n=2 Tax=Pseudonocardia petroleophila TaxID=37331 RepID=A0A7G7MRP6_9PSEU|nr:DNA ligase [Pseudonocardia petroleophila]